MPPGSLNSDSLHHSMKAEETLRTLRRAVEQTPATVVITDCQGTIEYANPKFVGVTGYSLGEALGRNPRILKSGKHPDSFYQAMWDTLLQGNVWRGELQNKKKNGEFYWESACISPVRDETGRTTHYVAIKEDITQRKHTEAALVESQHFLQSTLDALSAHIAILDGQGRIITVNAVWSRFARQNNFLGSDYGIGTNYLSVCESVVGECSAEAPLVAKGIRAVLAGECGEFILEYPCHSPQEKRWFLVRVTRFAGDGPPRVVVAHENITSRRSAEEELRWKSALLEAQVNSSIDGILVVDPRGRKILQNQRLTELFKIPQTIAEDQNDDRQRTWVMNQSKDPERFLARTLHLISHPREITRDKIEMRDGTILDRYSAPLVGGNGEYYRPDLDVSGHHRTRTRHGGTRARERSRGIGQPRQERFPGDDES